MRSSFPFIVLFLITTLSALTASGAIVSGDAFRWDTLEPLSDTIICIYQNDALIQQVKCDDGGAYSVNITPGKYHVTAISLKNDTVAYVSESNITISESGARIDLPMIPLFEELSPDLEEFISTYNQIELPSVINESEYDSDSNNYNSSSYTFNDGDETQSETGMTKIIKKYNYIFVPLLLFIIVVVLTAYVLKVCIKHDQELNHVSDTIAMETNDPEEEIDD